MRILAVDDIESNLIALDALLGSPSTTPVRARSGAEALALLSQDEFSLVIMDVQLPEMDGFETAAKIRRDPKIGRVPIIFVTAHGWTPDKVARAYSLGASDLLSKPIDPEALKAKVGLVGELWRMIEDARREAEARHKRILSEERQRWETEALRARVAEQERATAAEHAARVDSEQANRIKDEFLATLSHELRTPLNAILGWATMLNARPPVELFVSRGIEVIERNAKAQARLIEEMLDTSRIIAGKLRLQIVPLRCSS